MNECVGSPCVDGVKLKWLVFERLVFHAKKNLVDVSNIFQVFRNEKVHEIISWPSVCRLKVDNSYVTWLRSHMEIIRSLFHNDITISLVARFFVVNNIKRIYLWNVMLKLPLTILWKRVGEELLNVVQIVLTSDSVNF